MALDAGYDCLLTINRFSIYLQHTDILDTVIKKPIMPIILNVESFVFW